jgi:HEPN domain-containing protein
MDDAKRELVTAWLIKARNDWTAARQIAGLPDGPLDAAIYHCQQSAEKAVEGFLAFHDHRLERSHGVERLVDLAATSETKFSSYEDAAITLTPYATAYRYPGQSATLDPTREEFNEALGLAGDILTFVCSLLPAEVRPDK